MTREEAITKIKSFCHNCEKFPTCVNTDKECFKALEMAIEALEQEPCEDCVSRLAARNCITFNEVRYRMIEDFDRLPSVQPKPKTDVLDKIKAEIEEQVLESLSDGGDDWFVAEKVNECLEIIDKHTTESEDKE